MILMESIVLLLSLSTVPYPDGQAGDCHCDSQEMTFRFDNRKNRHLFHDTLIQRLQSDNLEHKELTAA